MSNVEYFRIEGATLTGQETVDDLRALASKRAKEDMTLVEALAVYIYLQHARYAVRDNDPAWIKANRVIGKYAQEAINRIEVADIKFVDSK